MIWLKVYNWNLLNENFLFVELTIHQKTKYLPLSNGTPKQETEKVILLFLCPESGRKEGAHLPCPHCKITIIKRSNNESAVSAAAYQSGDRLFSEYDQPTRVGTDYFLNMTKSRNTIPTRTKSPGNVKLFL